MRQAALAARGATPSPAPPAAPPERRFSIHPSQGRALLFVSEGGRHWRHAHEFASAREAGALLDRILAAGGRISIEHWREVPAGGGS